MEKPTKINIFYRHYNISGKDNKHRPDWFSFERCFENLWNTLGGDKRVKLNLMFDGTHEQLDSNWIRNHINYINKIKSVPLGSGRNNFLKCWEWAKEISDECNDNDLFYFLENDYIHHPGWINKTFELFSTYDLSSTYISLYDHNDKYNHPMYNDLVSKIFTTKTHHWRSTPSTCGSFIINKKLLLDDFDVPYKYPGDHEKFLTINRERGRTVITPIPGLSSHIMTGLMSPTINWSKF